MTQSVLKRQEMERAQLERLRSDAEANLTTRSEELAGSAD